MILIPMLTNFGLTQTRRVRFVLVLDSPSDSFRPLQQFVGGIVVGLGRILMYPVQNATCRFLLGRSRTQSFLHSPLLPHKLSPNTV